MKKYLILLIFLILLTNQKLSTKKQLDNIIKKLSISPLVSLLLIYDSLSPNAQGLQTFINSIKQKRKQYFNIFIFDCNTDDKQILSTFVYCMQQNRKRLPGLVFSQPLLNIQDMTQDNVLSGFKQYVGQLDQKSLYNFALPLMKTFSVQLKNTRDLKKFQSSYSNLPFIIYYTNKQNKQKIPPIYKLLTAHFRNTIAFAHVFSNSPLGKSSNITTFPTFMLNNKQKIQAPNSLSELIAQLNQIKGEPQNIYIKQLQNSNNVQLTQQNLNQLVFNVSQYIMIHVIGQDGIQHPQWSNITRKFGKMFHYYQTTTLKQVLGVKKTPAIVYFPKSLVKKSVQKLIFTSKDTFQDIHNQIDQIIQDFTATLSSQIQLQTLTKPPLDDDKFVAIFFHQKSIPLSYKVISNQNRFKQQIAFFRMKDPQSTLLDQYQIKKLPSLIVMLADKQGNQHQLTEEQKRQGKVSISLRIAHYPGRYNYNDIFSFLKHFSKKPQDNNDKSSSTQSSTDKIIQIDKMRKLKKTCQQSCYILLINGNPQNTQKNKNYLSLFQKQSQKIIGNFGYIDGQCHSQFISQFDIQQDQLPTLIHLDMKFQKYSRIIGRLQSNSILSFFSKIKSKRATYRGYDKLIFQSRDCDFERDKIQKIKQQSSKISQEQAQIIQQIRHKQQKKRQQFQKAAKQDKARRKGKKGKKPIKQQKEQL